LQSQGQSLEKGMDAHANLQDKRLPVDVASCSLIRASFLSLAAYIRIMSIVLTRSQLRRSSTLDLFRETIISFPWFVREGDLALVIVRVSHDKFIKTHDDEHGNHGDYHSEWQFALVKGGRLELGRFRLQILIEICNGFWDDVYHSDGKKERATEGHGQIHDSFVVKAGETGDKVPEDGYL
jgi:hypothetical protein